MTLESGPASGDRNYFLLITLLCVGMAGWFYYDGAYGYLAKNRRIAHEELVKRFGQAVADEPLPASPTQAEFDDVRKQAPPTRDALHALLGPPQQTAVQGLTATDFYYSDYGLASIVSRGGAIDWSAAQWTKWNKSKDQIEAQFYWMFLPVLLGLYFIYRVYRALTLRVTLDDESMVYGGRRIPYATMTSLTNYSRKGWVDLYHTADGPERKLRLDNQKVARFDDIIEALCARLGFPDPRLEASEEESVPDEEAAPTDKEDR